MATNNLFEFPLGVMSLVTSPSLSTGDWKGKFLKIWFTLVLIDASFGVSTYIHNMLSHMDDIEKLIEATFPVLSGIFAWTKLTNFIRKRKLFQEFTDDLKNMGNTKDLEYFIRIDQSCNKVMKIYAASMMITMVNATIKNLYEYYFYSIREFQFQASQVFLDFLCFSNTLLIFLP